MPPERNTTTHNAGERANSAMDAMHRSAPALVPSNTFRLGVRSAIQPMG
jgi:hypothetical protein